MCGRAGRKGRFLWKVYHKGCPLWREAKELFLGVDGGSGIMLYFYYFVGFSHRERHEAMSFMWINTGCPSVLMIIYADRLLCLQVDVLLSVLNGKVSRSTLFGTGRRA